MTNSGAKNAEGDPHGQSAQAPPAEPAPDNSDAAGYDPAQAAEPPRRARREIHIPFRIIGEILTLVALIAGVVVPTWVALYNGSNDSSIAAQNLEIAKEQLAQQEAAAKSPKIVHDPSGRAFVEVDGQLFPLAGGTFGQLGAASNGISVRPKESAWHRFLHSPWPFVIGGVVTALLVAAGWLFLRTRVVHRT
jgi:hypothetical protein